jgi:allantoinase
MSRSTAARLWPGQAAPGVALWVNPNVEFFGLDDVMPSNLNDRVPRDQAKIPNVRNWAVRDYGNRIGIWRLMEVLSRYGIRASAALNSEVCDHHPEIIEEGSNLGWEWIGHNQTNAMRLSEMDPAGERAAIRATIDRIEAASGTRPVGWLGAGLAETWNTLDYLAEAGIRYVCDWVNDDQPYLFEIGTPRVPAPPMRNDFVFRRIRRPRALCRRARWSLRGSAVSDLLTPLLTPNAATIMIG